MTTAATFYFDLGSPYAYLAAERLHELFAEPVSLQPISLGGLFKLAGRSSWSLGDPARRREGMAEVERRALAYGLPPVRWPDPWPGNYLMAMRAATFAARAGHVREFMTHAFRAAFQHGHDLSVPERVLDAAREAGLDPRAVDEATRDPEVKLALREATDAAHQLGVFGVPTVAIGVPTVAIGVPTVAIGVPTVAIAAQLWWGDDRLEEAAAARSLAG